MANRSHRDFSPHHRNHGTAFFLPGPLVPHHLCGRTREGPLSRVLPFKALPILVTFLINIIGNQKYPKEQASCSKGCMQQSYGVAVSCLVIPIKIIIKIKDEIQGNSIPLAPPILTSIYQTNTDGTGSALLPSKNWSGLVPIFFQCAQFNILLSSFVCFLEDRIHGLERLTQPQIIRNEFIKLFRNLLFALSGKKCRPRNRNYSHW